jgi:hypothetical protein
MSRRRLFQVLVTAVVSVCLLVLSGVVSAQGNSDKEFGHVKQVQERHTGKLMTKPGVVGTAVGFNDKDEHAVLVLLEKAGVAGIPQDLEGVPVHSIVTGKIYALRTEGKSSPSASGGTDPKARFPRPVPIGVSTGNALAKDWATGTIACRVTDGSAVYALSNNHVYALENKAPINSEVLQPGLYDTRGKYSSTNVIGNLTQFITINFGATGNVVDAAIAKSTKGLLGNATPSNGYGEPSSATVPARVGLAVQKYGRTTSLTKGTVYAINAIVTVGYSTGTATFTNQIIITPGRFSAAGDSGSLIVTNDSNRNPVGLLFAGSSSFTVANPIDAVLSSFGTNFKIDGK